jgi:glutamate synthase domain-containing protein 3
MSFLDAVDSVKDKLAKVIESYEDTTQFERQGRRLITAWNILNETTFYMKPPAKKEFRPKRKRDEEEEEPVRKFKKQKKENESEATEGGEDMETD